MRSFTVKGTGITVHRNRDEAPSFKLEAPLKWVLIVIVSLILAHVLHGFADGSRGYHTPYGGGETFAALLVPVLLFGFREFLRSIRERE